MLFPGPHVDTLPQLNGASDQTRAIVSTLIYYDLFAFPPSSTELERFAHRSGSDGHFGEHDVTPDSQWWSSREGYWFLKGHEHLIARREEMREASCRKLAKARRLARALQVIPGVRLIGVTGSLSMHSSVPEDDIDLLIITASGKLWTTRALVLGVLWGAGVKRPDDDRAIHPDQVCANIFLQEDDLKIPDHNIFIAHEICQMLPLVGPEVYYRFVQANTWVNEYLPQWHGRDEVWEDRDSLRLLRRLGELVLGGFIGRRLEASLMRRQMARIRHKHARGHNVGVKVSATQLRFHPRDLSDYVVANFEARWSSVQSKDDSVHPRDEVADETGPRTYP
jgi:hypothetical protein